MDIHDSWAWFRAGYVDGYSIARLRWGAVGLVMGVLVSAIVRWA